MSLILYINGEQADLSAGQVIAQTRQVNDLNSIQDRQASYTNKFSLPKTAHNVKLLNYLTLPGHTSNVPYQKNACSLYSDTGECFVYNGWAQITDGGDSYECVVYDGIIDLYKAIENKTLADLGLSELTHDKNYFTVATTWGESFTGHYRYLIADYNGSINYKMSASGFPSVNMDYLIPSVSVAWLWEKIFREFNGNVQPTGSIFSQDDFTNLWMTFPKGAASGEEQEIEVFLREGIAPVGTPNLDFDRRLIPLDSPSVLNSQFASVTGLSGKHVRVLEAGTYRLEFSGTSVINKTVSLKIGINGAGLPDSSITNIQILQYSHPGESDFNYSKMLNLNANDTVCIIVDKTGSKFDYGSGNNMQVRLVRLEDYEINFAEAFADFSIRDFVNEVVYRFGLTLYKDKFSNNYHFATLEEVLQTAPTLNWSSRFAAKISEDYMTGSYAQRNWLTYTYNDKEASHNDGYIEVVNANLPESKTLIKSKIYSPELQSSQHPAGELKVFKMWEKEANEVEEQNSEGETVKVVKTKYKALDKRYYFMHGVYYPPTFVVRSELTNQGSTVEGCWFGGFDGLSFGDIVQKYYAPLINVLSRARVVTAQLYLSGPDVANFDFNKFYYIEQLGGSFLVNKISNYIPGRPTTCELVHIRKGFYNQQPLTITAIEAVQISGGGQQMLVHFTSQLETGTYIGLNYLFDEAEDVWVNPTGGTASPIVFNVPAELVGQTHKMRLSASGELSNQVTAIWLGDYTIVV